MRARFAASVNIIHIRFRQPDVGWLQPGAAGAQ